MRASATTVETASARLAGHTRVHGSLLARAEKQALVWMASRLPAWINSDHLTALGFASMAGVAASFVLARSSPGAGLPLVVLFLFLNWLGDSLDGTVARVRNKQRPRYGYYVDHVVDIAGTSMMLAGLALSGYMHPLRAVSTLALWLLVAGESFLATNARRVFRLSFMWLGPTELRILIAAAALSLLGGGMVPIPGLGPCRLFDVIGVAVSAGLIVAFTVNVARNVSALYREETVR
ncbi:MAG TPA: CDP-alcohol phosphatidyltransferase family protein [Vicinamibacterales bacterium]|nr:CDP-alcohol phosphatidyltransferase family protein [Vicinamibacterales bacterium]HOQ60339.1 CDP-alcohol phosphatidyltransferase family protein [Vicinamibacterales bacterium]HPK70681.1 CDP-alcohol phosphatidyltransferase family protein [Vicinamibacterales bacterium]